MRILTAGESHGQGIVVILEGFPKGVKIEQNFINQELQRRMSGFGRGKRMSIEQDSVNIISGLRHKITLGSPIAILVKNRDIKIFSQSEDSLAPLFIPRPAHADLSGAVKYQDNDIRNILERASARETVARVCAGAVCKQLLSNFKIMISSFTVSIGSVSCPKKPNSILEIINKTKNSLLRCLDKNTESLMIKEIKNAQSKKDTLGGIIEVWIHGIPVGLGSFMHYDRRLDAKLAAYIMSIPAVKGVEIGLGFDYARGNGSETHDAIYYNLKTKKFYHKTNNSGGIEGGISNGEPITLRLAMKPIATLQKPLDSVNLITKKPAKAIIERSDTCAVVACAVIAENMSAIAITESFLEKFGSDTVKEIKSNYQNYLNSRIKKP
ncbi:MAG: chorismate synthase [Candidatus Omnitrophica bacterium]|jgi:chorismate synthase|nr:chorismate synthase [Candidatus Omnitrophota bacterium]